MNNQNNTGQYGYVNRDGKLVPSNTINGNRVNAKETAGSKATSQTQQRRQATATKQTKPQQTYAERTVQRETTAKKQKSGKGIKKLCVSLSLIMILAAAKQMPFNVNARVTEIASKNGNHNYMDDIFASDETIEVVNPKTEKTQKIQLEDAVNKLEDYVEICKLIDDLNIGETKYSSLNDKEKKAVIALYEKEGVDGLIKLYKDNTANPIEKARTVRQLMFIRDYFGGDWIEKNGLNVAEALLEKTIQTAAIENYGTFKPTEYGVVKIPTTNEYPYFLVSIEDPVSGATDEVMFTPILAGEYAQAILTLRDLRTTDASKLSEQEKLEKIQKTIRIVKKCLNKDVEDIHGITYTKKVK